MPPQLGDVAHVEIEIRLAFHQRKAFGERLHHAVLDAVVNHLHEVSRADRPGVQPAAGGGRRKGFHVGFEPGGGGFAAAEHDAVAVIQPPHPARHAGVGVVDLPGRHQFGTALVVLVIGVGAVDHQIARAQQRGQFRQRRLGCLAGRQHQPDDARSLQCGHQIGQAGAGEMPRFGGDGYADFMAAIVDGDLDALARQTPRHVSTHATQTDNSKFHFDSSLKLDSHLHNATVVPTANS